jgi:Ni/Co efflux regulator RcnB
MTDAASHRTARGSDAETMPRSDRFPLTYKKRRAAMIRATIYTAAAAGFLAIAAPGAAQAAMPVNAGIDSAANGGMVQTVRWHHGHHWRRWHRRHHTCWVTRRVHWRHGHKVVTRVRHCGWRW